MKKIKCLFIIFIFSVLLAYLYQNYIYYLIPYNPLDELATDIPNDCYLQAYYPNGKLDKSSYNLNNNTLIFKYFSDLNLVPLKVKTHRDEIYKHKSDVRYSYILKFGPPTYHLFIREIWLDDLSIMSIRSDRPGFRNGYYKIIDSKFDYIYVNKLIGNYEN